MLTYKMRFVQLKYCYSLFDLSDTFGHCRTFSDIFGHLKTLPDKIGHFSSGHFLKKRVIK